MPDDARVAEQPLDVALAEPRDAVPDRSRRTPPEVLALAQDRQPREPGLEALEAEPLVHAALVVTGRPHSSSWYAT